MASPSSKTDICNLALSRIGALRVTSAQITADTEANAKLCNLHYEQTRDALLRSHWWRFASARASLTASTTPSFEWAYSFTLPTDFLRFKAFYEDNNTLRKTTIYPFAIEGSLLLTDESACKIRYIKQEITVTNFDPLFIEVLVLALALKLVMPLSQDKVLYDEIKKELYKEVMPRVRAMDRQETDNYGVDTTWNQSRLTNDGRIDSKLGSS